MLLLVLIQAFLCKISRVVQNHSYPVYGIQYVWLGNHQIHWVCQNRIYTLCMTVCMMISLPKVMYIHRIYL